MKGGSYTWMDEVLVGDILKKNVNFKQPIKVPPQIYAQLSRLSVDYTNKHGEAAAQKNTMTRQTTVTFWSGGPINDHRGHSDSDRESRIYFLFLAMVY